MRQAYGSRATDDAESHRGAGTKQIDESEREREVPASGAALIGSIAEPSEA